MPTIPDKQLQNSIAELGPTVRRHWVSGADLARVWATPAPETLGEDLERFPAGELVQVRTP